MFTKRNMVIVVIVLIICAFGGAGYWAYGKYFSSSQSSSNTFVKAQPAKVDMPNIITEEVLRAETNLKPGKSIPLGPAVFADITGKLQLAEDRAYGLNNNLRYEAVGMNADTLKAEAKDTHNITIPLKNGKSLVLPELPRRITGSVYYSNDSGAVPLNIILSWGELHAKAFNKWRTPIEAAGLKEVSRRELPNNSTNEADKNKVPVTYLFNLSDNSEVMAEVLSIKDTAKKTEEVYMINLYMVSKSDKSVRENIETQDRKIIDELIAEGKVTTGQFVWRAPAPLSPYRVLRESNQTGIHITTLTDKYFPGTDAEIIGSSVEYWNSFPIGRVWLIAKPQWSTIKSKVITDVTGRSDITDTQLLEGIRSKNNIFISVQNTGELNDAKEEIIKVNIIDKNLDWKISSMLETVSAVDVGAIRNNIGNNK